MAGSNAIASGAAILTANADGLVAGLRKSEKDIQDWGKRVSGKLTQPAAGKGGSSREGGGLAGMLGKGKGAGLAAGLAIAGVAAVKFGSEVRETVGDLAKMDATAKAMGLTAEQFTGMAGVAKSVGEDTREFIESLVTMGKLGTDAANGTKEASAALKGLGIDANQFIKLRADEQFFQIFDSLSKVQDPLQRTRFLMQAFGEDGGKYLLPLLEKTPEKLREMAREFAVSGEQMKKARAADEAVKRVTQSASKLWRSVAIGFAPLLEGAANFAGRLQRFLQPAFDWIGRAWDTVLTIGTAVWDAVGEAISGAWDWFKGLAASVSEWTGGWPTVQEVVVAVFRAIGISAALAWDTIKLGAGAIAYVAGVIIEQGGSIVTMFRRLVDLAKSLPEDLRPKWLDDFVAGVDRADEKVKEFGGKMKDWGKGAVTSWGQSAVQFSMWLDEKLKPKAKEAGKDIAKGITEAITDAAAPVKLSGAMLKGSKETYSLMLKNQLRGFGSQDEPIKQVVKEAKKGNELTKKVVKSTEKTANILDGLGVI